MKAITLRNLPPDVARTVQQRAKQKKTSVNKAVIELLEESVGGKEKRNRRSAITIWIISPEPGRRKRPPPSKPSLPSNARLIQSSGNDPAASG